MRFVIPWSALHIVLLQSVALCGTSGKGLLVQHSTGALRATTSINVTKINVTKINVTKKDNFTQVVKACPDCGELNSLIHRHNAAEAALRAREAAMVATRTAAHAEEIARDAAAALIYTRDALRAAEGDSATTQALGTAAENLEAEAGTEGATTSAEEYAKLESEIERLEIEYEQKRATNAQQSEAEHVRQQMEDVKARIAAKKAEEARKSVAEADAVVGDLDHVEKQVEQMEAGQANKNSPSEEDLEALRQRVHELKQKLAEETKEAEASRLDINTEVVPFPNGGQPFGYQDTANALTNRSILESEGMIDQIERAQTMEGKRAVYRALTRLRGVTIAAYDGIAQAHMANVVSYGLKHSWRAEHPIKYLAEEEADPEMWAFPGKTYAQVFGPAGAPAPGGAIAPAPKTAFEIADTNSDGHLSESEFNAQPQVFNAHHAAVQPASAAAAMMPFARLAGHVPTLEQAPEVSLVSQHRRS